MAQIAVMVTNNIISDFADENSAKEQSKVQGWILVDNDPAFSPSEMFRWTVRSSDNVLVHVDTMLTPEEESHKSTKELTDIVLANSSDIEDIKKSVMLLTNMKLNPDATPTTGGN